MKRKPVWIFVAVVVPLLASSLLWNFSMQAAGPAGRVAKGQSASDNPVIQNFDIRYTNDKETISKFESRLEKISPKLREKNASYKQAMRIAKERKARSVPGMEVSFCNLTNSPEVVEMRGSSRKALTPLSTQSRENIVKGFMKDNTDLFGMNSQQVDRLRKDAEYANPNGQLSWLRMEQRWNGMKVFRGEVVAAFTRSGELIRIVGEPTRGPEVEDLKTDPVVSAAAAVVAAAASVNVTLNESELIAKETSLDGRTVVFHPAGPFTDDIKLELQYFPLDAGLATLAWSMVLWQESPVYHILVDAEAGGLLWLQKATYEQTQPATYAVYDADSPLPLYQVPAFRARPYLVL
jgi:hypothetical protein